MKRDVDFMTFQFTVPYVTVQAVIENGNRAKVTKTIFAIIRWNWTHICKTKISA
jgi:hypothetical protein